MDGDEEMEMPSTQTFKLQKAGQGPRLLIADSCDAVVRSSHEIAMA